MIDKRALKSAVEDLVDAARRLEAMSAILDGCIRKRAQEGDEPSAEPPAEAPAEEGGGDFKDEGTTGEEGGEEDKGGGEGDLGDLDLGGPGGFGGGGGGGGFGGPPPSGGLGADTAAEDAGGGDGGDGGDAGLKKDMAGLQSEIEGVKRTLVNVVEALDRVRDPLRDPLRGNDALQSV